MDGYQILSIRRTDHVSGDQIKSIRRTDHVPGDQIKSTKWTDYFTIKQNPSGRRVIIEMDGCNVNPAIRGRSILQCPKNKFQGSKNMPDPGGN